MPTIAMFYGIVIAMFANDHPPPHFHATYGEFLAIIEIDTGRLIAGKLPRAQLASVERWRQQHIGALMENWDAMPGEATSEADTAAPITYPARMYNHGDEVKNVIPLPGYRLAVRFFDGTSGIVDMSAMIAGDEAGIFAALRDPTMFNSVAIDIGTVIWPNGADLAPDAMHDELAARGEWRLT